MRIIEVRISESLLYKKFEIQIILNVCHLYLSWFVCFFIFTIFFLRAASKSTIHLTKLYIFSTRRRKWIRNSFAIYYEVLIQIPVILDWVIEAGEDELYNVTIQKSTRLKSFKGHATPFPVTTKRLKDVFWWMLQYDHLFPSGHRTS